MKMRKWGVVVFLFFVGVTASIAFAKLIPDKAYDIPKSPELYTEFIGENSYSTVSFGYRTNQDIPICFLIDLGVSKMSWRHDEIW